MTNHKLLPLGLALISACLCVGQTSHAPFACNLKAFTPEERQRWRALIDQTTGAVMSARELPDGYALHLDTRKVSLLQAAEWIALERRCCPFFDFQLDVHGEDGAVWLALKGREGVKQFIQQDFKGLEDRMRK